MAFVPRMLDRSNLYEEPRPPRRGSHRPEPVAPVDHALNFWCQATNKDDEKEYETAARFSNYYHDWQSPSPPSPPLPLPPPPRMKPTNKPLPGAGRLGVFDGPPIKNKIQNKIAMLAATRYEPGPRLASAMSRRGAMRSQTRPSLPAYEQLCHGYDSLEMPKWDSSPVASSDSSRYSRGDGDGEVDARSPRDLFQQLNHFHEHTPRDRMSAVEQSILESYVQAAPQSAACQSVQKRCMYPSCTKISVSRGLCRGHGGGRRCHVAGCTKSAQSRSNFCWAHGGGQRCEVDQCMRSRKSKRFCVAHVHLEAAEALRQGTSGSQPPRGAPHAATLPSYDAQPTLPVRALPSLGQALSSASRSAPNLPARGTSPLYDVFCVY